MENETLEQRVERLERQMAELLAERDEELAALRQIADHAVEDRNAVTQA